MKRILSTAILLAYAGIVSAENFTVKDGVLTVRTKTLSFQTAKGRILSLKTAQGDKFNGNVMELPDVPSRRSVEADKDYVCTTEKLSANEIRMSYFNAKRKIKLFYDFKIEGNDVLFRNGIENYDLARNMDHLDFHITQMKPKAVITGIGSRTLRNDPKRNEHLYWSGAGYHFPRVLIAEGNKGVIMFYNESPQPYHNVMFYHTPESDHIVLRGGDGTLLKRTGKLLLTGKVNYTTSYWRMSVHPNWLEAARAWQKGFEKRTGAKPLWNNSSRFARNIHAVYTGAPHLGWKENPDEYYKAVAKEYDPSSIILLYWNAPSILTFGDHRYKRDPRPPEHVIEALRRHGFQWMAFHGYTLLCNEDAIELRHKSYFKPKDFPKNYKFTPDYQGKPEDFYKNMAPYLSRRSKPLAMVNPAAKYVEDYLVHNISNYAAYHKAAGFYMDITGGVSYALKPGKMVFDGKTYTEGDVNVFRRLQQKNPDLLMMSEYAGEWLIPYTFYTWEAPNPLKNKNVRVNHPLRGALYGTYMWSRESIKNGNIVKNAYYATLPEITNEFGSKQLEILGSSDWHNERAKLFCREKLFNALPDKWDDDALAYYRSEKNGFFQFRKMPFGYAYLDAKKNTLLGIYEKQTKGLPGHIISTWCAYDNKGCAIGLDPEKMYLFHRKKETLPFRISNIPAGCYIDMVRQQKEWTTFSIHSKSAKSADIRIDFVQKPYKVYVNGKEIANAGTRLNTTIPVPANILILTKQSAVFPLTEYIRNKNWVSGFNGVNGLHSPHGYRGYANNMHRIIRRIKIDGEFKNCICIGSGKYSAYMEKRFKVPADKKALTFTAELGRTQQHKKIPVDSVLTISANGREIYSGTIPNEPKVWKKYSVNVAEFAGQDILLNFTFRYGKPEQESANVGNHEIHITDLTWE